MIPFSFIQNIKTLLLKKQAQFHSKLSPSSSTSQCVFQSVKVSYILLQRMSSPFRDYLYHLQALQYWPTFFNHDGLQPLFMKENYQQPKNLNCFTKEPTQLYPTEHKLVYICSKLIFFRESIVQQGSVSNATLTQRQDNTSPVFHSLYQNTTSISMFLKRNITNPIKIIHLKITPQY